MIYGGRDVVTPIATMGQSVKHFSSARIAAARFGLKNEGIMDITERLEAGFYGIGHLLADRCFVVPNYQTGYLWTCGQIEGLLRDLSKAIRQKDSEYFLGTVVLTRNPQGPQVVIDGQRRLTTISILICAIRNYFIETGDRERAEGLHRQYLARKELRGLSETAHLTLTESDNAFYETHILSRQGSGTEDATHARLETALRLCTRQVTEIARATNEPTEVLLDWVAYLHDQVKVIVVEVGNESAAYAIVDVLKGRRGNRR